MGFCVAKMHPTSKLCKHFPFEVFPMRFTLVQYPAAIAQAAQAVNEIDYRIGELKQHLGKLDGNAELVVAFDVNLKNDNQRKARRFEVLQVNLEYEQAMKSLNRLNTDRANAMAMLEQLRNEFSAMKIETRLSIVDRLAGVESRELVGI
jgi:chromosome segregation ATPase